MGLGKCCVTCKEALHSRHIEPCLDCEEYANWEPKETNTNLIKDKKMNEQKIYDVTVVERIEDLHEASGVIQGIKRKVLVDEKFSAVTEESAKQKALKKCKAVDFDTLEITCRPF